MKTYLRVLFHFVLWAYILLALAVALLYPSGLLGGHLDFHQNLTHIILGLTVISAGGYMAVFLQPKPHYNLIRVARRPFRISIYGACIVFALLYYVSSLSSISLSLPTIDLVLISFAWILLSYHYLFCAVTDPIIVSKRVSYTCWFAILFLATLLAIATALNPDKQIELQPLHRLALLSVMTTLAILALYPLRKLHRSDFDLRRGISTIEKQMTAFRLVGTPIGLACGAIYIITITNLGGGVSWIYKAFKGWAVLPFMIALLVCGALSLPKPAVGVKTLSAMFWILTGYLIFLILLFFLPRDWIPGFLIWLRGQEDLKQIIHWFTIAGGMIFLLIRFLMFLTRRRKDGGG